MKKWSKFFTVALAMAGFLFAGTPQACSQQPDADAAGYIVKVGDMAPDFEMTLTDGTQVKLSSLRGKVVMLQPAGVEYAGKRCLLLRRTSGRSTRTTQSLPCME